MMRSFKFALLPALLAGAYAAQAQSLQEAIQYSNQTVQGTARSMGFGNTLGSVGGDFSSISVNPAGLGVYRSSELMITPSLRIGSTSSQYLGTTTTDNNTRFNINNFGLVATKAPKGQRYEKASWKSVSFALGMNRVADFNYNYNYSGRNTTSSASQVFEADANRYPGDALVSPPVTPAFLGFQSYLLDSNSAGGFYSVVPFAGGINQTKRVQTNGGISEGLIALGGNYKERLMLGMSIGIPIVNFLQTSTITESVATDNQGPNLGGFQSFTYNQGLDISGFGFNAKLGAIYKINDAFRVGASFHTPAVYYLNEEYTPGIAVTRGGMVNMLTTANYLETAVNNYRFTTPWRTVVSGTFILKKLGFITADFEYVGYSSMKYRLLPDDIGFTNTDQQAELNKGISNTYQSAANVRIGAEGRVTNIIMLRAGFGYYGNPYKTGVDATRMDFSAGIGFRFKHFFTDLAFVRSMYQLSEQPYRVDYDYVISGAKADVPIAITDYVRNNVAWTIGVKF